MPNLSHEFPITCTVRSVKTGEIVKSVGLPWQNVWEVCVEADGAGNAASSRAEEGINLGKPTATGLGKLGISAPGLAASAKPAQGSQKTQPPPPAAKRPAVSQMGTQKAPAPMPVGTQRAPPVRDQPPSQLCPNSLNHSGGNLNPAHCECRPFVARNQTMVGDEPVMTRWFGC